MTNVHVLALHGEIDISQKQSVEQELAQIEGFGPSATTILDLNDVGYVDSTFLNALCQLKRRLDNHEPTANLCIVAPRDTAVSRLFAITELDRVFSLFEDISSARRYALQRLTFARKANAQARISKSPCTSASSEIGMASQQ